MPITTWWPLDPDARGDDGRAPPPPPAMPMPSSKKLLLKKAMASRTTVEAMHKRSQALANAVLASRKHLEAAFMICASVCALVVQCLPLLWLTPHKRSWHRPALAWLYIHRLRCPRACTAWRLVQRDCIGFKRFAASGHTIWAGKRRPTLLLQVVLRRGLFRAHSGFSIWPFTSIVHRRAELPEWCW